MKRFLSGKMAGLAAAVGVVVGWIMGYFAGASWWSLVVVVVVVIAAVLLMKLTESEVSRTRRPKPIATPSAEDNEVNQP